MRGCLVIASIAVSIVGSANAFETEGFRSGASYEDVLRLARQKWPAPLYLVIESRDSLTEQRLSVWDEEAKRGPFWFRFCGGRLDTVNRNFDDSLRQLVAMTDDLTKRLGSSPTVRTIARPPSAQISSENYQLILTWKDGNDRVQISYHVVSEAGRKRETRGLNLRYRSPSACKEA